MTEQEYLEDIRERRQRAWPAGVTRELVYPFGERPITEYLRERARQEPDRVVLIYYGREFTFSEVDDLSDRFASFLTGEGVQVGDRVTVMMPNCPQFLVAFYGILKAGCVHAPVNPMVKELELEYHLQDTGATILIVLDSLMPLIEQVQPRTAVRRVVVTNLTEYLPPNPTIPVHPQVTAHPPRRVPGAVSWEEALTVPLPAALPEPELDRLAALNYTSGTTGMPKGCMHTQRNMIYTAACASSIRSAEGVGNDVSLVFIPVFWIAGENSVLISPIFSGTPCVLLTRWDPDAVLAAIQRYRVTGMGATVDNYLELMENPCFGEYDLSSLKFVGAMSFVRKLNLEYRERWKALVGGRSVLRESAYGMTETHTIDTFTAGFERQDHDLKSQPVFTGMPMPGTELKICDFETGELLPLGKEGAIWIWTPSLFKGYWRRPEATAEVIRDGWFYTGDIGMLDEDGCLHFLGRRKEMLKVNGMSVFPAEIEVLLGYHPGVAGTSVVGRPDPERGEVPVAFIKLKPESRGQLDADSLAHWCRQHMATYKVPEIRIVDEFPLTPTGKVQKNLLLAQARSD